MATICALGTALSSLNSPLANAAESEPPPLRPFRVQWVGDEGKIQPLAWPTTLKWVWKDLKEFEGPALVLEIRAAQGVKFIKATSPQSSIKMDSSSTIQVALHSPEGSVDIAYTDAAGKKKAVGGFIQIESAPGGATWAHGNCIDAGIRLEDAAVKPAPGAAPTTPPAFLFVGISCSATADRWKIRFFPSTDVTLKDIPDTKPLGLDLPKPKKLEAGMLLGGFGVSGRGSSVIIRKELRYRPEKRWSFNVGLGFTGVSYKEHPVGVNLFQIGATPKLGAVFRLTPNIDLGISGFITALPIYVSPSGTASSRFYGLNLRGGYRFSNNWLGARWTVSAGMYFWGMSVKDNAYGVAYLLGPQFFLFMDRSNISRPYFAYFKIAPTAESVSGLSLGNRELALGGGMRVNSINAKHRVDLTLDLSNTTFTANSVGLNMSMSTVTLGVQFDLTTLILGR